jgi:hypothetical protein
MVEARFAGIKQGSIRSATGSPRAEGLAGGSGARNLR